jgi:hypothetical protein
MFYAVGGAVFGALDSAPDCPMALILKTAIAGPKCIKLWRARWITRIQE